MSAAKQYNVKQLERDLKELKDLDDSLKGFQELFTNQPSSPKGRPSKLTPQVVTKLVAAFNMGYNDTEATAYSGISRKTFYDWMCDKPDFRNKINKAKMQPTLKAKEVLVNALNSGDLNAAKWWLERKSASEFSTKPSEVSIIPPELQEYIAQISDIVKLHEQRIAYNYRTAIFRLREQERASNRARNGKPSPKEDFYTHLLELPDAKLADYVQQEVTATGQDIAGVREVLLERVDFQSIYRKELERAKKWNDEIA